MSSAQATQNQVAEISIEDKEGNDIQIKQVGGSHQNHISENFMVNEVD